jgi:hypothetical protein
VSPLVGTCGCSQRDVGIIWNADAKRIVRGFAVTIKLSHAIGGTAPGRLRRRGRREAAEILKGVEAGAVAISPLWLQGIATDQLPSGKFETLGRVSHIRPGNIAQHIRLATARSARAGPPQTLKGKVGFFAIIPLQGEFFPDELNVLRRKAHVFLLTDNARAATGGSSAPPLDDKKSAPSAPN